MRVVVGVDPVSPQRINALLEGLVRFAGVDLANNPTVPPLYQAGVRYKRERPDQWSPPTDVWRRGRGDCEDLAAWRAAELRARGEHARAVAYRSGPRMWHVVVRRADGSIEDPSKKLGMKG